ncbi:MAG: hypothetical protein V4760_03245 [Bdellovibrionota bacterium]
MPNTWTLPDDQVDAAAATAENLARAAKHSGGSELPALANSTIDDSMLKRFQEWLASLFKFKSAPSMNLEFLFTFLYWLAIALVVISIAYFIYWLFTRARGPAAPGTSASAPIPKLSTEALLADLQTALAAGQFARASRIRWRLFLVRNRKSSSMTPYEHFRSQTTTLEGWLTKQYRTMFAGGTITRPDYDELEAKLTSLEPASGGET